jgi:hypothetical protein
MATFLLANLMEKYKKWPHLFGIYLKDGDFFIGKLNGKI